MIRGERFDLGLVDDGPALPSEPRRFAGAGVVVQDIVERPPQSFDPSVLSPKPAKSLSGFPEHKKRGTASRFKRQQHPQSSPDVPAAAAPAAREADGIDAENRDRLSRMTPSQIEHERQELLDSLPSSLLQKLLKKANIDDPNSIEETVQPSARVEKKTVTFAEPPSPDPAEPNEVDEYSDHESLDPPDSLPVSVHFPRPPPQPTLDPSSATFLEDLHEKYFPDLPADPSKLAWMADADSKDDASPYSPDLDAVPVTAVRFSFRGTVLPPSLARQIPVYKGLHHHGDAPESAGYTIPELAHLSRSSFPSQRCIAYSVLGRFLYRLGRGEFGGPRTTMVRGLWKCIEDGRVIDTLTEESSKNGGHASAKAYATEALWLWQRGGGKRVLAE